MMSIMKILALVVWIAPSAVSSFHIVKRLRFCPTGHASWLRRKAAVSEKVVTEATLNWHPPPVAFGHHINSPDNHHRQPHSIFGYGDPSNSSVPAAFLNQLNFYQLPPTVKPPPTLFHYGGTSREIGTGKGKSKTIPNFVQSGSLQWYAPPAPFPKNLHTYQLPPTSKPPPTLFRYGAFKKSQGQHRAATTTSLFAGTNVNAMEGQGDDESSVDLPTYDDVVEAAGILEGVAHVTPVETSRTLDEQLGVSVFFKCENKQRMGAF